MIFVTAIKNPENKDIEIYVLKAIHKLYGKLLDISLMKNVLEKYER
jgi:hypothetical protein